MIKLQKREKQYLILLGIVLFIFVYTKYIMLPVNNSINRNRNDIDLYKSQLNILRVSGITNTRLEKQLGEVKQKYNGALLSLPLLEKNPEIAYNLKPMADASNITLENVSLSDGILYAPSADSQKSKVLTDNANLYSINANLNVSTTDYSNIMDFLSSVENDKRINEVTNFSIQYQRTKKITSSSTNTQTIEDSSQVAENTGSIGQNATQTILDNEPVSASISVNYFYNLAGDQKPKYNFNNGKYGKDDLFK